MQHEAPHQLTHVPGPICLTFLPLPNGCAQQVDGERHVLLAEEEAMGTRLIINTLTCLLAKDVDTSRLVVSSPGKLVR